MPTNNRTRFRTFASGGLREIFSVSERDHGELTLFRQVRLINHPVTGLTVPHTDHHYSIHPSEKTKGTTTITHKAKVAAQKYSKVALVHHRLSRLVWPVFSAGIGFRNSSNVAKNLKRGEREIILGQPHDLDRSCLVYSVFVASPALSEHFFPEDASFHREQFTRYQILVFFSYFYLPTPSVTTHSFSPTSAPQLDGEPLVDMEPKPAKSLAPNAVATEYHRMMKGLRGKLLARINQDFDGPQLDFSLTKLYPTPLQDKDYDAYIDKLRRSG
jgi:hypothetical protein